MRAKRGRGNENGMVLVTALLILTVLIVIGTIAVMQTSTDVRISGNYKTSMQAFYAAEAGIEEARGRLRSSSAATYAGDPASADNVWWSAYISSSADSPATVDPDYNASYTNYMPTAASHTNTTVTTNSLQSDMEYIVKIIHKNEFIAEEDGHSTSSPRYYDGDGSTSTHSAASPGNIIYYGYGDPSHSTTAKQFTTGGSTEHAPVEIITAWAKTAGSVKSITVEVVKPPAPPIKATLYTKDDVTLNGSSMNIDGSDYCGAASDKPPIYTKDPHTTINNGTPTFGGSPATPVSGPDDIDIAGYVSDLKASATEIITADQNGTDYGSAGNFVTCYCDATTLVQGLDMRNLTGYGILLVEGDLTLSGGFTWYGVILATGTLTFNGGGPNSINVRGAVLGNDVVDVNGGVNLSYDSCSIEDALSGRSPVVISWKENTGS